MLSLRSEDDVDVEAPLGFMSEHHGSLGSCTLVVPVVKRFW